MLLGTLGASLLWNMLSGKGTIATKAGKLTLRAGESTIRAGQIVRCRIILKLNLKYKSIIKMNLNLVVCVQEIICLKWRMAHM